MLSRNTFQKCSCLQMFFKIGVFINFLIFIRKYMCWRLFLIKLQPWWSAALLKRRPQHRCFPVNIATCLRITFFMEHLRWLLLKMVEEFLRISNSTREISDLKISVYVRVHITAIPWRFRILDPKNFRVIGHWSL